MLLLCFSSGRKTLPVFTFQSSLILICVNVVNDRVGSAVCQGQIVNSSVDNLGVLVDSQLSMADHVASLSRTCLLQLCQLRLWMRNPRRHSSIVWWKENAFSHWQAMDRSWKRMWLLLITSTPRTSRRLKNNNNYYYYYYYHYYWDVW